MNKICQNCKYHYIEEISFDYPQSCCNRTNPHYTTEAGLHCDNFEYSEEYMKTQLKAYENMKKEAKKYIEEHIVYETDDCINGMQFCSYHLYDFSKEDLLNILNKVGGSDE